MGSWRFILCIQKPSCQGNHASGGPHTEFIAKQRPGYPWECDTADPPGLAGGRKPLGGMEEEGEDALQGAHAGAHHPHRRSPAAPFRRDGEVGGDANTAQVMGRAKQRRGGEGEQMNGGRGGR